MPGCFRRQAVRVIGRKLDELAPASFAPTWLVAVACCMLGIAASPAAAQFVQLPSYSFYSNDSSFMVPDRGGAYAGAFNRSSAGSSQFGLPFLSPSRAYGSQTSAGGVSVFAQIHDQNEMDAAVLARARDPQGLRPVGGGDLASSAGPTNSRAADGLASVEELRARDLAAKALTAAEAEQLVARAHQAISAGKAGAAKVYLQMAAKRANEPLKSQVLAELRGMDPPALAKKSH